MGVLYEIYKDLQEARFMNDNIITPSELEERLLTIQETTKTKSERIYQMHQLVIELLTDLGYEDGADIYAENVQDNI